MATNAKEDWKDELFGGEVLDYDSTEEVRTQLSQVLANPP
jgi:hypothetical protein